MSSFDQVWLILILVLSFVASELVSSLSANTPVVLSQNTRAFRNIINQAPADKEKPFASITYTAVVRGKVALPCNIEPPTAGDEVVLVLWYKDDIPAPIFTLDARRGDLERAPQSTLSDLGKRAFFNMANKPAFLQIDPVQEHDAGEYRCRVDFKRARSINTVINLRVIVPSGEPAIVDEEGSARLRGLVGPFNEGDPLVLVCQSEQGKPRPSVTWWKDYRLIDESYFFDAEDNLVKNVLEIEALTRDDLLSVIVCQASNNNITVPNPVSVTLDLNLKPLDVTIEPPSSHLSANQRILLKCTSSGSRPAAKLSWWMNGRQLKPAREDEASLKSSSSVLMLTPTAEDNGKMISCRAENALIPGSALEHGLRLDVHYPPQVSLELASYINPDDIREQMDIRLTCHVNANPQPVNVTWLFEGDRLRTDLLPRVIQSSTGILIRRIQRVHRGTYMCQAENSQGKGTSNDIRLKLKFSPLCKSKQRLAYGIPSEGEVSVLCDVDADPDDLVYHWAFDSTVTGAIHNLSVVDNTRNVYTYKVSNVQVSYGTLLCWAKNSIGVQREPCRYRIVPAGPPDPLVNCTQTNATSSGISLKCYEGTWDGGLRPLSFYAQVYDMESGLMVANTSHHASPENISISRLPTGSSFRVAVFAVNVRGVSAPHVMMAQTMRIAEKYIDHEVILDLNPLLLGIALAVPIASVIFFVGLKTNCATKMLKALSEDKVIRTREGSCGHGDHVKKRTSRDACQREFTHPVACQLRPPDIIPHSSPSQELRHDRASVNSPLYYTNLPAVPTVEYGVPSSSSLLSSYNNYDSPIYQRPLSLHRRQSLYYQKSMVDLHDAYLYDSPINSCRVNVSSNAYNTLPLRRELLKSEYYLELTDDNVESSV